MPASVYRNSTFVFAERSKGKVTLRTGNLEVTWATKMRKQLLHWERSPAFCERMLSPQRRRWAVKRPLFTFGQLIFRTPFRRETSFPSDWAPITSSFCLHLSPGVPQQQPYGFHHKTAGIQVMELSLLTAQWAASKAYCAERNGGGLWMINPKEVWEKGVSSFFLSVWRTFCLCVGFGGVVCLRQTFL